MRKHLRRRRGGLTLEMILLLPILILSSLAIIQFGIAMTVDQAVTHAATVAAREAAKGVTDIDDLGEIVELALEAHDIKIGDQANIVLEVGAASPVSSKGPGDGGPDCSPPSGPTLAADELRVTVCVDMSKRPYLNVMGAFGLDFSNKVFTVSAVSKVEQAPMD